MSSNISNTFSTTGSGPAPNTEGPHKSDMLNRADPRVDSDRDNSRTIGGNRSTGTNVPEGTYGTHNSRVANAADPRIDSDHDRTTGLNSHNIRGTGLTGATGTGPTGTHGTAGLTGTQGTHGYGSGLSSGTHEGAHGPHSSRVANAADPRVDSDRDGSRTAGTTHGAGYGTAEGTHGPHSSRVANAADPRVDSDRDHRAAHAGDHSTTTGDRVTGTTAGTLGGPAHTGPAPHTAGPHKSDLLNKLDPRVDSNLDGSKTIGGDKTYAQS
jgi:hypothetical protein